MLNYIGIIILAARAVISLRGFAPVFFLISNNFMLGKTTAFNQIKRGATTLYDNMSDLENERPAVYWYDELESTMSKARELIPNNTDRNSFAVVAGHQSAGRGTRGRKWMSGPGNLFLTVVLRVSTIPAPLTLIPLRVGTLIIPSIASRVTSGSPVVLKWPNDVLIGNDKVCGVLIEIEGDFMLIGIGCNIMSAPAVESVGVNNGRPSTCLSNHIDKNICNIENTNTNIDSTINTSAKNNTNTNDNNNDSNVCSILENNDSSNIGDLHKEIAKEIYTRLSEYILSPHDSADMVTKDFERYMNFAKQKLRGDVGAGGNVLPLRVNKDGTLQVRDESGNERALVAEYLW